MNDPIHLKEEIQQLKNNFEWLDLLFQDSLEENNQLKLEYLEKLIEVNDRLRQVKTESE